MGRQGNQPTRSKGDHRPMTKAQAVTKRSSPRGDARKKRIIEVATSMLARNGSRGTTLSDIAAAAGVSQAGVVYHYGTKEELLHAVLDYRDQFEDTQLGLLRPRLRRNYQLTIDRIAGTLRNAQERGEMRADADPRLTATEILAFLSGLELAWLVSPDIPAAETASRWAANQ